MHRDSVDEKCRAEAIKFARSSMPTAAPQSFSNTLRQDLEACTQRRLAMAFRLCCIL
jgi:hypothetical protein